jgi:hypothetical protein
MANIMHLYRDIKSKKIMNILEKWRFGGDGML